MTGLLILAVIGAVALWAAGHERRTARRREREGFTVVRGGRHRNGLVFTVDGGRRELDLSALAVLAWRFRHHLAPVTVTVAVWLASVAAWKWLELRAAVPLAVGCAGAAIGWAWWRLDRTIERAYATTLAVALAGWFVAAVVRGPSDPVLVRVLVIGALLGAVPWWTHRRVRSQVRVERTVAAWPGVAENVGLAGSHLVNVLVSGWGWTGRLVLRGGQTVADVISRLRAIESGLRLPIGSVRVEPWADRADVVVLRVVESDPHAEVAPWPNGAVGSIADRLPVGLYDDGQVCAVPLYDRETGTHHALVAGTNGSGKSGLLNLAAAHAVAAPDAVLWGIDLKGGIELRPWWSVCDWLVTTSDGAAAMLAALRRIIDARGQVATGRVWQASAEHPAIVALVDEAAELPAGAVADLESVARRGRALGVALVLATQYPTADAVGSTQVRAQLRTRAAFRFQRAKEAGSVLSRATGADPSTIRKDRPGCCYVEAAGAERSALVRCYWISDEHVTGVVQVWQDAQPALDPVSANAAGPEYAARHRATRPARTGRHQKLDNDEARQALRAALIEAGEAGCTVDQLCAASDRRKSWVYRHLEMLTSGGRVERTGRHGRYRATDALRAEGET